MVCGHAHGSSVCRKWKINGISIFFMFSLLIAALYLHGSTSVVLLPSRLLSTIAGPPLQAPMLKEKLSYCGHIIRVDGWMRTAM